MSYNNYDGGYNTSYGGGDGGGGGGGGGGFMPDGSQNSPSGGRKDYSQDSLRPVTIKQILEAQPVGEGFSIDGSPITQLTFIGQICNISYLPTHVTYKLDDGTGSIEVKQWINNGTVENVDTTKAKLVEGSYCRAWGNLKDLNDRRHVGVHILRPVEDMNEISYHLLEATAVHLHFTRGPLAATGGTSAAVPQNQQQQPVGGGNYGGAELPGYSAVAKRVYQYMRDAPQTNEGLHQQDIAAKIGVDTADVARAGDDLLSGGFIYTTVDDQTWAILEAE